MQRRHGRTDANGTRKTNDAYCIKKTEEEEEERGFYLCCFCESSNEEIDDVFDKKLHLISRTFTKTSLKFREREKKQQLSKLFLYLSIFWQVSIDFLKLDLNVSRLILCHGVRAFWLSYLIRANF